MAVELGSFRPSPGWIPQRVVVQFRRAFEENPEEAIRSQPLLSIFHTVSAPRGCTGDEGRSLGADLQELASNHLKLLPAKAGGSER